MQVRTVSKTQVVIAAMLSLGMWGISCADKSELDLWTVKGEKDPTLPAVECTDENATTECNDKNPCTLDRCNLVGLCENTANEGAIPPTSDNPCQPFRCDKKQLVRDEQPDGAVCGSNDVGMHICRSGECSPGCATDGDCSSIMDGYCFEFACVSCSDNVKNGDEVTADCGGHCKKCLGDICGGPMECKTGHCTDGVCCNDTCANKCKTCNLPGATGTCTNTPQYEIDDNPGTDNDCTGTKQCDGSDKCQTALGFGCSGNGDCASDFCSSFSQTCRIALGDSCTANPADCFSGYCNDMTKLCDYVPTGKPCANSGQCLKNCMSGFCT